MESDVQYPRRSGGPFQTVIVAVDEHQGGRDATALAENLLAANGSLVRAHVVIRDPLGGRNHGPESEATLHFRRLAPAREANAREDRVRWVVSTSVGRALHELAAAEGADLIVVGSCHRGLLGRVMIGDVISDALDGAPCAIAIAPFGYAERPSVLERIGVAYNGSPESQDALAVARGLVDERAAATLSGFQVVSFPSYLAVPGLGSMLDSVPDLVEQARAGIATLGDIEPHAAYGMPAEELGVYSAALDLLVVGSRGYGPVGRLVHGSTSRGLARSARCPLLVLTRDACGRLSAKADRAAVEAAAMVS